MCFPQPLISCGCLCMKNSSIGNFFHLMRYWVIVCFYSCLSLVSRIVSGSSIVFPSSLISSKIVWIGTLSPITLFEKETWKNRVHVKMETTLISNPYFQSYATPYRDHSTWILIYFSSLLAWGMFVCMGVDLEIPNPPLQILNTFMFPLKDDVMDGGLNT